MTEDESAERGDATSRGGSARGNQGNEQRGGWVGIAANAGSGMGGGRRRVERLASELARLGLDSRVAWTVSERSALVGQSNVDPACRCLVAAGGDGTVGALVNERPRVPITVLPAGTENLFAQHFELSRDPARLAATIAAGAVSRIDLGLTGDRRFTLMAGIGFDADVVTRHHAVRLNGTANARPTHRGAYVQSVLASSLRYRFPQLTVTHGEPGHEETLVGTSVFLFNLPRYALGLPFAPSARGNDGWLNLVIFREAGPFRALYYLWLVARGAHLNRPGIFHRKVRKVTITADHTVPIQLDGDPGGFLSKDAPWSADVLPGAIDVIVPR
jgi:diacylglycerol kinase family enzyme